MDNQDPINNARVFNCANLSGKCPKANAIISVKLTAGILVSLLATLPAFPWYESKLECDRVQALTMTCAPALLASLRTLAVIFMTESPRERRDGFTTLEVLDLYSTGLPPRAMISFYM